VRVYCMWTSRNLISAFSAIGEMADRLGLVSTIKDRANENYRDIGAPSRIHNMCHIRNANFCNDVALANVRHESVPVICLQPTNGRVAYRSLAKP
jgi:hypothetical protein